MINFKHISHLFLIVPIVGFEQANVSWEDDTTYSCSPATAELRFQKQINKNSIESYTMYKTLSVAKIRP